MKMPNEILSGVFDRRWKPSKCTKEHRIRARDQHLVYHFILGWLIALLISWMGVFYFQEFRQFDISRVSLSTIETVWSMKELICLLGSLGFQELCCCFIFTFPDHWRSLWHRQN